MEGLPLRPALKSEDGGGGGGEDGNTSPKSGAKGTEERFTSFRSFYSLYFGLLIAAALFFGGRGAGFDRRVWRLQCLSTYLGIRTLGGRAVLSSCSYSHRGLHLY